MKLGPAFPGEMQKRGMERKEWMIEQKVAITHDYKGSRIREPFSILYSFEEAKNFPLLHPRTQKLGEFLNRSIRSRIRSEKYLLDRISFVSSIHFSVISTWLAYDEFAEFASSIFPWLDLC